MTLWMGEFDEAESWLRHASEVEATGMDPAAVLLLRWTTGMLHVGRRQHRSALEAFMAAEAQALLSGVHMLAPSITGRIAATQARLGMTDEARATLQGLSAEAAQSGEIYIARAVICLAEGEPATALDELRDVVDGSAPVFPAFTLVEAYLLAGIAHFRLGDQNAAWAAAEAALTAAEPDRLILPFAMAEATELIDAFPRHETAHAALLADILDVLHGSSRAAKQQSSWPPTEELSPGELRVLRYLPTNLSRPEIAGELSVAPSTVSTHIKSIYAKLCVRDRSSAVQRARELRKPSSRSAAGFHCVIVPVVSTAISASAVAWMTA
jgi:LuxR family maltose regulon positive regulatory protein